MISGIQQQTTLFQQVQTDIASLKADVTAVNERLNSFVSGVNSETRGSGRRKVPNELAVSYNFVTRTCSQCYMYFLFRQL